MGRQIIELTGEKIGEWTVLEESERDLKKGVIWRCRCDCGNENYIQSGVLIHNTPKCKKCAKPSYLDITGQKFHKLTALKFLHIEPGLGAIWLFKCDCGNQKELRAARVKRKKKPTKSCGCMSNVSEEAKKYNTEDVKYCTSCKQVKDRNEFNKSGSGEQGYCKECQKKTYKEYYEKNLKSIKPKSKTACLECGKEGKLRKGYCLEHYKLFFIKKYNRSDVCIKCFKPHHAKGYCKQHYKLEIYDKSEKGRESLKRRRKRFYKKPENKILKNIRRRASQMIKKISQDKYKKTHFLKYLGCTSEFFKNWIESQFTEGMSWCNYGQGKGFWCIDHIKPISKMNTDCEQSILEHCHYTNLQPMWFEENIAKSDSTDW